MTFFLLEDASDLFSRFNAVFKEDGWKTFPILWLNINLCYEMFYRYFWNDSPCYDKIENFNYFLEVTFNSFSCDL